MLPRYIPAIDVRSRLQAIAGPAAAARDAVRDILDLQGWKQIGATAGGRFALAAYFRALAESDPRRTVLLSAQICPIVPLLLLKLGFRPCFVDITESIPTPGVAELVPAFQDAGGADAVIAVLLSPFYGYLPADYDDLADRFAGSKIVLDLAQATLLGHTMPRLMRTADAAIFSFGVGKGADIGGGLLAVRNNAPPFRMSSGGASLTSLTSLPPVLALRILIKFGLYGLITTLLDEAVEAQKADADAAVRPGAAFLPDGFFRSVASRLPKFAEEVRLAGTRAADLRQNPHIIRHCRDMHVYGDASQMHLRQIIRLAEPARRDEVLHALRHEGIDALAAGEPLPTTYLDPSDAPTAASSADLGHTRHFLDDSVRLPFLGRIDQRSYARLIPGLENALG